MKLIKINTEKQEEEIKNIKIRFNNPKESAEAQKKLFSLGIGWAGGMVQTTQHTTAPFIFIDNYRGMTYGHTESGFIESEKKEMTIKELMKIKTKKKKKYVGIITNSSIYVIKHFSEEEFRKLEKVANDLRFGRIFSVNLTDKQKEVINKDKLLENKSLVWLSKERFE